MMHVHLPRVANLHMCIFAMTFRDGIVTSNKILNHVEL